MSLELFEQALTQQEQLLLAELTTPFKIQEFLDTVPYSPEPVYRCPLQVLRDRLAHCFDGALFAAAALRRMGYPPLILEMLPNERDDDHLLALFKIDGHWGAIAKSNFAGLRFREPVFRNLRELVLSYFEQYYNVDGEKTLRGYTVPMNLSPLDHLNWMTSDTGLDELADRTDLLRRYWLLSDKMISRLSPVDERTYKTGLDGANQAGLFKIKD